jgi:hypothetical protein
LTGAAAIANAAAFACAGCGDTDDKSELDEQARPQTAAVVRAPDGSLRVPFLGGAFVTRNREMPIEIQQAIAGLPPDHPVVVWAGP